MDDWLHYTSFLKLLKELYVSKVVAMTASILSLLPMFDCRSKQKLIGRLARDSLDNKSTTNMKKHMIPKSLEIETHNYGRIDYSGLEEPICDVFKSLLAFG